ncbi:hypothetical protein ACFR99_16175 [Haloarchaeobius amylolyticus]|uniref:Uncharacterized protein n=1 Tax=Haloarchaeobius amylolyticus TaxID=1198296 RepID=A0ABD6BJF8_9EURY
MMRRLSQVSTTVRKRLPPVARPVAVALLLMLSVLAVAVVTGAIESVVPSSGPGGGWETTSWLALIGTIVVLAIVTVGSYLLYRRYADSLATQWQQLSKWAQALIAGAVCGTLVATGLGVATVAGLVPLAFVPVGVLVAWPTATVVTRRQRRTQTADDSPSALESALITTGYAQLKLLQTRTLAGIVGLVGAVLGSIGIRLLLSWLPWADVMLTPLQTAVLAVFLWLIGTVLVYNRYESTITNRTALTIVGVSSPERQGDRELTIKNAGTDPVDLARAKLRDTNRDRYQFDVDVTLGPGACCSFGVPASFLLEPNDAAMALPLGYTLKQGSEHPTIYTRDGEQFVLQQRTEPRDHERLRDATRQPVAVGVEPTRQE